MFSRQKRQHPLSRNDVFRAYRMYLGRNPESDAVIEAHRHAHRSIESLYASLKGSEERRLISQPPQIYALNELDNFMKLADTAANHSPEKFRALVNTAWFDLPSTDADPDTPAFRDHQLQLYEKIAGHAYSELDESHDFDAEILNRRPYPYNTESAGEVGSQLVAIGSMILAANLPAKSSILELGIGWGNTAFHLARMGHRVVGIDIEPKYSAIIREQARVAGEKIEIRTGSFYEIENMDDKFDAVLFFESFHHAYDHLRLLDAIPGILKPGGKLLLAGEAIDEALPYPWGINWSGIAVYSIRKHGWLELAFRESYLMSILSKRGWEVVCHPCPITAAGITYVAQRRVTNVN